jgi:hypothetical protein
VEGYLRVGEGGNPAVYQLKNSGAWGASYEVTADAVRIIKGKDNPVTAPSGANEATRTVPEIDEVDIPF